MVHPIEMAEVWDWLQASGAQMLAYSIVSIMSLRPKWIELNRLLLAVTSA
jgi:hypothetical protein